MTSVCIPLPKGGSREKHQKVGRRHRESKSNVFVNRSRSTSKKNSRHQPRRDRHGHEFLEQQLACVGEHYLHHLGALGRVLAALEGLVLQVRNGDEAAGLTHVDPIRVALVHQAFFQKSRRAVRDDAIALHLPETQPAVPGPALHGLPRQDLHRPPSSAVDLVIHHVLQALVVRGAQEYLSLQLAPGVAVVHYLIR